MGMCVCVCVCVLIFAVIFVCFVFHYFLMILLVYNSCTGGYIVIFTYVFKIYLSWIYPLHHIPFCPLSPILRTISTGFILLFSYMDTKYIHIYTLSPFPCAHPPPTGTSQKRFMFPSLCYYLLNALSIIPIITPVY
jgi:hypothetical protein